MNVTVQSQSPLVSVIVPAYNSEPFLERTLASVLAQSYQHLEVLVVDDGSIDHTAEIVQRLAQYDPRLALFQQSNAGVAAARNLGIDQARGEFIAPVDADDIWHPQYLERLLARIREAGPRVGLVYAWAANIDQHDELTSGFCVSRIEGEVYNTLLCHNFIGNASSSLIRRSYLEKVGGYDTELHTNQAQGCEDWDLSLRLAEHYQFAVVPEFLVGYRKNANAMSRQSQQMARSHALIMQKAGYRRPQTPKLFYRLSSSLLYLYFAKENQRNRLYNETLKWLWEAVKAERVTPWFRFSFYQLAITSALRLAINTIVSPSDTPSSTTDQPSGKPGTPNQSSLTTLEPGYCSPAVSLHLWLSDGFHRVISVLSAR